MLRALQGLRWTAVCGALAFVTQVSAQTPGGGPPASSIVSLSARQNTGVPQKQPLSSEFILKQSGAGFAGATIGLLTGTLLGVAVVAANFGAFDQDFDALGPPLLGFAAGYVIGAPIGVHMYSNSRGVRAPFLASLAGSTVGIVGAVGGPLVFFTVPLGAVAGHNLARRPELPRVAFSVAEPAWRRAPP